MFLEVEIKETSNSILPPLFLLEKFSTEHILCDSVMALARHINHNIIISNIHIAFMNSFIYTIERTTYRHCSKVITCPSIFKLCLKWQIEDVMT